MVLHHQLPPVSSSRIQLLSAQPPLAEWCREKAGYNHNNIYYLHCYNIYLDKCI